MTFTPRPAATPAERRAELDRWLGHMDTATRIPEATMPRTPPEPRRGPRKRPEDRHDHKCYRLLGHERCALKNAALLLRARSDHYAAQAVAIERGAEPDWPTVRDARQECDAVASSSRRADW